MSSEKQHRFMPHCQSQSDSLARCILPISISGGSWLLYMIWFQGGCVLRLGGLYSADSGAHSYWAKASLSCFFFYNSCLDEFYFNPFWRQPWVCKSYYSGVFTKYCIYCHLPIRIMNNCTVYRFSENKTNIYITRQATLITHGGVRIQT